MYIKISDEQLKLCHDISGLYLDPYVFSGTVNVSKPFNKEWHLSPWQLIFEFHPDTGYFYCSLDHRMSSNYCYGWDINGHPLANELVERIFPAHW